MRNLLLLAGASAVIILIAKNASPKFSLEAIDKVNKKIKYSFDGNINSTGDGDNTIVPGRNENVLIAQGDGNGVAFTFYQGDVLKKRSNVLYNQDHL